MNSQDIDIGEQCRPFKDKNPIGKYGFKLQFLTCDKIRATLSRGYKSFCLSMIFIMLINVKMSTIVGILTFISRINDLYHFGYLFILMSRVNFVL